MYYFLADEGKSVRFAVRDKCMGCKPNHIDMALKGFTELTGFSDGEVGVESEQIERRKHFSWKFVDAQPRREMVH